jgi:hypothetical protein
MREAAAVAIPSLSNPFFRLPQLWMHNRIGCVHNTLELPGALFEVITFWTGGMLRLFFLGRVLRASAAPKGFALDSSPRDGFLPAPDPMGKMIAWELSRVLSVLLLRSKPSF